MSTYLRTERRYVNSVANAADVDRRGRSSSSSPTPKSHSGYVRNIITFIAIFSVGNVTNQLSHVNRLYESYSAELHDTYVIEPNELPIAKKEPMASNDEDSQHKNQTGLDFAITGSEENTTTQEDTYGMEPNELPIAKKEPIASNDEDSQHKNQTVLGFAVTGSNESTTTREEQPNKDENIEPVVPKEKTGLDFAVIGFPKTGTSFLLRALGEHPEVVMPKTEFCQIHENTEQTVSWLRNVSSSSSDSSTSGVPMKYGIKCPTMVRRTNAIDNLVKISDDTRLVVGLRHPILWFQSFYNYRVGEHYKHNLSDDIPSPFDLSGHNHWRDVSTAHARFDIYLRQLAKVAIDQSELNEMLNGERLYEKSISPNPFKVFIYSVEQLYDPNVTQQVLFRQDLQHFLGLETPLIGFDEMPRVNVNHDSKGHPEHLDICKPRWAGLRHELLRHGRKSSSWILDRFIKSKDVFVSDEDHFSMILSTWGEDPCEPVMLGVPGTKSERINIA